MNIMETPAASLGIEELDELTVPILGTLFANLLALLSGLFEGLLS